MQLNVHNIMISLFTLSCFVCPNFTLIEIDQLNFFIKSQLIIIFVRNILFLLPNSSMSNVGTRYSTTSIRGLLCQMKLAEDMKNLPFHISFSNMIIWNTTLAFILDFSIMFKSSVYKYHHFVHSFFPILVVQKRHYKSFELYQVVKDW